MTCTTPIRRHRAAPPQRQRGLSLLEILVAVLIVSVGILGVAGLQGLSLRNNTLALHRTEANQLAHDIFDRIRANSGAAVDGDYDLGIGDDVPAGSNCETNACTPTQLASYDLREWMNRVEGVAGDATQPGLPQGDASIAIAQNNNAAGELVSLTVTVTLRWATDRAGNLVDTVIVSEVTP